MPHRRLVRIGETPALPTISQFLTEMANRQHEEIVRLKREAKEGRLPDPTVPEEHHDDLTPDPWQLHPVRIKKAAPSGKKTKRSAKKTARKSAKKAAKVRSPKKRASARNTPKRSKRR